MYSPYPLFYFLFLQHPEERNVTYFSHMKHALKNASILFVAVIVLCIHSIVPKCFETTGSTLVKMACENLKNVHNDHNVHNDNKNKNDDKDNKNK